MITVDELLNNRNFYEPKVREEDVFCDVCETQNVEICATYESIVPVKEFAATLLKFPRSIQLCDECFEQNQSHDIFEVEILPSNYFHDNEERSPLIRVAIGDEDRVQRAQSFRELVELDTANPLGAIADIAPPELHETIISAIERACSEKGI